MKKVISIVLGILFLVIVVLGIFVCTYILNQPARDGESKELISGKWIDEKNGVTFNFSSEGNFSMYHTKSNKTIAKGYFKINEDEKKIKILVVPKDRDDSVDLGLTVKFFATISYMDLVYPTKDSVSGEVKNGDKPASCNLIFNNCSSVYSVTREDSGTSLYNGNNGK